MPFVLIKKFIGEFLNSNFIGEDSEAQIKLILYGHKMMEVAFKPRFLQL